MRSCGAGADGIDHTVHCIPHCQEPPEPRYSCFDTFSLFFIFQI